MRRINLRAMAKINLSLDVIGTRPDGYHDLRMVMQSVRLSDQVTVSPTRAPGVRMKTNLRYLPADQTNLAARAAALVMEECGIRDGVFINLEKLIPVAAGRSCRRKLGCGGCSGCDESAVRTETSAGKAEGDGEASRCRYPLLHHAGHCPLRGNRGNTHPPAPYT